MQDTGIVRRIDELGRVVIPKELRRTLRMREGDPLEIYTDNERLIFKKYSPIASINTHASAVAEGLREFTNKTCIITDNDSVVYVSGANRKEDVGKTISVELEKVMKNRKSLLCNKKTGKVVKIIKGEETLANSQAVVPIISQGDCYGSVVVLGKDGVEISEQELKMAELGASFLSRQFD